MKVGDKVARKVTYGDSGGTMLPPKEGTVVYIHPERMYFTLEFVFDKGRFRESFPLRSAIHIQTAEAAPEKDGGKYRTVHRQRKRVGYLTYI